MNNQGGGILNGPRPACGQLLVLASATIHAGHVGPDARTVMLTWANLELASQYAPVFIGMAAAQFCSSCSNSTAADGGKKRERAWRDEYCMAVKADLPSRGRR